LVYGVAPARGPVGMPLKGLDSNCSALEDSLPSVTGRASADLKSPVGLLVEELGAGRTEWACASVFCGGSDGCIRGSRGKPAGTFDTRSALGPVGG
jgi:hypothetical protein